MVEHLKAATRNAVLGRSAYQYDDDGPQQMCLLNQYLAWCLLGLSELPPSSTAGSSSDSCNHSGISSSSGSTGAAREAAHSAARMATGPASSSGAYAAAMSLCLAGYNCILDPVARVDGHPAARELHEVIVAPATGEGLPNCINASLYVAVVLLATSSTVADTKCKQIFS